MKNLISIIGLAPSELSREALLKRIELEHLRVVESLTSWVPPSQVKKAKLKRSRKKVDPLIDAAVTASGMTTAEILKLVAKKKAAALVVPEVPPIVVEPPALAAPPASWHVLTPGTPGWMTWWKAHPEDQEAMVKYGAKVRKKEEKSSDKS